MSGPGADPSWPGEASGGNIWAPSPQVPRGALGRRPQDPGFGWPCRASLLASLPVPPPLGVTHACRGDESLGLRNHRPPGEEAAEGLGRPCPRVLPCPPTPLPTSISPALDSRVLDRTLNGRDGPETGPPGRAHSHLKASGLIPVPPAVRIGAAVAPHGGARWAPGFGSSPWAVPVSHHSLVAGANTSLLLCGTSLPTGLQAVRGAAGTGVTQPTFP